MELVAYFGASLDGRGAEQKPYYNVESTKQMNKEKEAIEVGCWEKKPSRKVNLRCGFVTREGK